MSSAASVPISFCFWLLCLGVTVLCLAWGCHWVTGWVSPPACGVLVLWDPMLRGEGTPCAGVALGSCFALLLGTASPGCCLMLLHLEYSLPRWDLLSIGSQYSYSCPFLSAVGRAARLSGWDVLPWQQHLLYPHTCFWAPCLSAQLTYLALFKLQSSGLTLPPIAIRLWAFCDHLLLHGWIKYA